MQEGRQEPWGSAAYWIALYGLFSLLSSATQDQERRTHTRMGSLTSIINQRKALRDLRQANLIEVIPSLRFLIPSYVQVCAKLAKPNQHGSLSICSMYILLSIYPQTHSDVSHLSTNHLPICLLSIHFPSHPITYLSIHPQTYSNTHSSNPHIYLHVSTFQCPVYSSSVYLLIHLSCTHQSPICPHITFCSSIHCPYITYPPIIYLPIHYLSIHPSSICPNITYPSIIYVPQLPSAYLSNAHTLSIQQ